MQPLTFHDYLKLIGSRLKEERKKLGYSQEDVALRIRLGRVSIAHAELGQHLKLATIWKLARLYRINPGELFRIDDEQLANEQTPVEVLQEENARLKLLIRQQKKILSSATSGVEND